MLTKRQKIVLKTLAKGYSFKFAANLLNKSPRTLQSQLIAIKERTNIYSTDELFYAFHTGQLARDGYL